MLPAQDLTNSNFRGQDFEEADGSTGHLEASERGGGRFRSSRSYIKSLIDALTKAKAQTAPDCLEQGGLPARASRSAGQAEVASEASPAGGLANEEQEEEFGVVMSQMDISAAHLILAYMERHLDDKEQLQREWAELNAASLGASTDVCRNKQAVDKINQLNLQRLAKVALSDENRPKNRNPLVVPFDRNRVKLGCAQASKLTRSLGGGQPKVGGFRERNGSDYINASHIYDDDPRRPTHIVAQGPSAQTCAQFWQVSFPSALWPLACP